MGSCVQCGSPIPDEQNCCSMCYGDPEYGRDGYYQAWLEEQEQEEYNRLQSEREEYERLEAAEAE